MKNLIKVLAATSALSLAGFAAASDYNAGWYAGASLGWSFAEGASINHEIDTVDYSFDADIDDSLATGLYFGKTFGDHGRVTYRAEGEISYRNIDIDSVEDCDEDCFNHRHADAWTFMANGFVNFHFDGYQKISPYVGAGIGLTSLSGSYDDEDFSDVVMSTQLIAGMDYKINDRTTFFADYRWQYNDDFDIENSFKDLTKEELEFDNHTVNLGLRVSF